MSKPLRSQATRDRILEQARRLFAEQGFERTTIRAVATAAAINPSMVMRYYGSKEDLFAAAVELDFHMPDLAATPKKARGEQLITHVFDLWEASDELTTLLRSAGTHEAARARLVDAIERQSAPAIVAVLPGEARDERLAQILMLIGGLVYGRYVLKNPVLLALDRATLVSSVGAMIQRLLG